MSRITIFKPLGVRPETRDKIRRIAEHQRRDMYDVVDLLADDYLDKHGLGVPNQPAPPSDPARGETAKAGSIPPASPVSQSSVTVSKRKPVRSGKRITDAA